MKSSKAKYSKKFTPKTICAGTKIQVKSMEKFVHKTTNKQQTSDFHYWQNQPPLKRLEALEQIRREYHQYKYNAEPRFQRVYTIVKRQSS